MKHLIVPVLLIVFVVQAATQTQKVSISAGFLKGKDYLDMESDQRRAYAMGAINGMLVAPMLDAPSEKVAWLGMCTKEMSDEQIAAILAKYITDRPSEWHYPLNLLSLNAMINACPRPKTR